MSHIETVPIVFNRYHVIDEIYADDVEGSWDLSPRITFQDSPHRDCEDIILRGPVYVKGMELPELHAQLECEDYESTYYPEAMAVVSRLYDHTKGQSLGRVILAKLPPGKVIHPHRDEGPVPEFYTRYHCCIQAAIGSWFIVADEAVQMLEGRIYRVDVRNGHCVINLTNQDRLHLIVDIHLGGS